MKKDLEEKLEALHRDVLELKGMIKTISFFLSKPEKEEEKDAIDIKSIREHYEPLELKTKFIETLPKTPLTQEWPYPNTDWYRVTCETETNGTTGTIPGTDASST